MNKPTHMDLFSGIGGFALAAQKAGFQTTSFCEIDPFCRKVLNKHWPYILKYLDIKDISRPDHVDLITGGFPCQPFSQAGNKRGTKDERYLWPEFLRIIKLSKPSWVIIENVCGIISMELDNILLDLEREDYEASTFILPACAANAPHRRDRVWIIANSNSFRSDSRISDWSKRYLQENKIRNLEKIQSEWQQFKRSSWETNTAKHWLQINANLMRDNYGIPDRLDKDRIKALGNAIVPQVIFPILKFIKESIDVRIERNK